MVDRSQVFNLRANDKECSLWFILRGEENVNFPFDIHNEAVQLYSLCSYAKREQISFHEFLKKCFLVMFEKKKIL